MRSQVCGQHLFGHRPPWAHLPASSDTNPVNVTIYDAHLGNECADHATAHGTVGVVWNKKHAHLLGTLRSIPLRCVPHVKTLSASCRYYPMSERLIYQLHTVWSEACGLFNTVSLCGLPPLLSAFTVVR